jgi:hypothetical protein
MERAKGRVARLNWVSACIRDFALTGTARAAVIGRAARTRHPCSCYGCGNPRRHFKSPDWRLTLQERRAMEAAL